MRKILLDERQTAILTLLADGQTNIQIGRELDYDENYIGKIIRDMKFTFGAKTVPQLIAMAYHNKILLVPNSE